jgi:SAM-dependent methyltransferase
VLDAGCGTGDHAIFLAERGYDVTGVDRVATAIRTARERAVQVGGKARFVVGDAMKAAEVDGAPFDAVLDSGLLHQFGPADAARYVGNLHDALVPGGKVLVQCFSDTRPVRGPGPRQLSEADLRAAFAGGWTADWVRPAEFLTTARTPYSAWLGLFTRVAPLTAPRS